MPKTSFPSGPAAKNKKRPSARKTTRRSGRSQDSELAQLLRALTNGAVWGVLLVLLGLFTLLALISSRNRALTGWWLDRLSLVFGLGMYLLPIILIVAGFYLYLRSSDRPPRLLPPYRIFGFLLLWMAFQATAHLLSTPADPLGAGQPGDLGGWIGWVMSELMVMTIGTGLTIAVLLLVALVGVLLVIGVRPRRLAQGVSAAAFAAASWLYALPGRLRPQPSGVIRVGPKQPQRPGLFVRLGQWWMARQQLRAQQAQLDDGPITSLPPDRIPPPPAEVEPGAAPPSLRIIGGEQTHWRRPRVADILEDIGGGDLSEEDLAERARIIEETLGSFGVPVTVIEVNKGPVVTQFGLRPEFVTRKVQGEEKRFKVRVSKIQALSNDLSLALAASPIRIEAPVPGRNIVGLEVPNQNIATVSLRSILESEEYQRLKGPLRVALGQDVTGRAVAASLSRMPHLLVAGATGSGKSVCVNAIICSLLFEHTPDQVRFVMVDPKRVELTGYNNIPHLVAPVVTEIERVIGVLHWATKEMDDRYRLLSAAGARNIEAYNARRTAEGRSSMPYIVIIVDELADIMMMSPDEVEKSLVRLAQMARATGIHLIIATQRPSVDVVTGLIKANFPSRVAFAVTSQIDSRVILDTPGAERLLGRGDMLFMRPDSAKLSRLQGAFVSDTEVNRLVRYWRGQGVAAPVGIAATEAEMEEDDHPAPQVPTPSQTPAPAPSSRQPVPPSSVQRPLWEDILADVDKETNRDELFDDAMAVVRESGKASASLLQRRLRIGYTRAARLIDMMEAEGLIGPDAGGSRGREVIEGAGSHEADEAPFNT